MKPKISVIIAAYNEEKLIGRCINSLQAQDYPRDNFEIIVVDNNSVDKTAEIAKSFNIKVFSYTKLQGCGAARQFGALQAKGEIFAFTDSDCIVPADWLTKIDKIFTNPKIVCVGGRSLPDKNSLLTKIVYLFYDLFFPLNHLLGKPIIWGHNMAARKGPYTMIGGINSYLTSSEDWDLAIRLKKRFGKKAVRYDSSLAVVTSARKQNNLKVLFRYTIDGIKNYLDLVIRGKSKAISVFNVR